LAYRQPSFDTKFANTKPNMVDGFFFLEKKKKNKKKGKNKPKKKIGLQLH